MNEKKYDSFRMVKCFFFFLSSFFNTKVRITQEKICHSCSIFKEVSFCYKEPLRSALFHKQTRPDRLGGDIFAVSVTLRLVLTN